MRGASLVLGVFVVVVASAAACAEGDTPGFENVGGGGGASGEGGEGEGGDSSSKSGSTSGQATGASTVTTSVGSSTTTGGSTTTSSSSTTTSSSTGTGGAPPCPDTGPGEPGNDQMTSAHDLGEITDSDDAGGTIAANLQTPDDADWYFFLGEDTSFNSVDPSRQVIGAGLRVCKYLECTDADSTAAFDCPSDAQADTQGGLPGCCWNGPDEHTIGGFSCDGGATFDEGARVYIRVDHVGGPGCENYTLKYHF